MLIRKFMAATLSLGLACGGASLVHAHSEHVNLFDLVNSNYVQMCKDTDLRRCCLMCISGSDDESILLKCEDNMLKNPEIFKRDLVSKLSRDEQFRKNYLNFLESCEKYQKHYEDFMNSRSEATRWPPTW